MTIPSVIPLYSGLLHKMMKSFNLEHSVQKRFFSNIDENILRDKISAQVSHFSRGQRWNIAELAFTQLADILSVVPHFLSAKSKNYFLTLILGRPRVNEHRPVSRRRRRDGGPIERADRRRKRRRRGSQRYQTFFSVAGGELK